ncbi:Imm42 family immunity protein [Snodgrassella communis]|jgi:hypothetical protein|uniref:Imm42 family immunity protein n=1 Tax=Snodgrassella communis TaxID=2946699 RepID=UPI000C1F5A75|nr:Imm42 family immunity protein [Snodgrassella communis]PIT08541.1 hypothetical protein BGI31_05435 [Snodgrassella communis]
MIFGDPYYFSISFDVVYPSESSAGSSIELGIFNFIIEDNFFPAKGGNWTINMIINHLKSTTDEIKHCPLVQESLINSNNFFVNLSHSLERIVETDPIDFELGDIEKLGVDLTPLEFGDFGYYIFYVRTSNKEYIFYSYDRGSNFVKKELPINCVLDVISSIE